MIKKIIAFLIGVFILVIVFFVVIRSGAGVQQPASQGAIIHIVAAENFYGNIAQQLGGSHVSVTSLLSDPNVDPHEYESSVQDGVAITNANMVIENGLEYDTWMDKLISASPNIHRILIIAGDIAPDPLPENPHVWYGVTNIQTIAASIDAALIKIDPEDQSTFTANLAMFDASLVPIQNKMAEIKSKYAGTSIGLTETIYLYQTEPMGLDVLTPFNFEKAIAEGNDPSAQDVNTANQQISQKKIKVLIFNSQTLTPITTNLQSLAETNDIPIVPVSETMPPNVNYQTWMMDELNVLEQDLASSTGR